MSVVHADIAATYKGSPCIRSPQRSQWWSKAEEFSSINWEGNTPCGLSKLLALPKTPQQSPALTPSSSPLTEAVLHIPSAAEGGALQLGGAEKHCQGSAERAADTSNVRAASRAHTRTIVEAAHSIVHTSAVR